LVFLLQGNWFKKLTIHKFSMLASMSTQKPFDNNPSRSLHFPDVSAKVHGCGACRKHFVSIKFAS
jgi:hypothetical protein